MTDAEFDTEISQTGQVQSNGGISITAAERRDIWDQIQKCIKKRLGVERFGLWFKQTQLMELSGSKMVIGVSNVIKKQYLEQKYKELLKEITHNLTNKHYEVRFDVAPDLLRRNRKSRSVENHDTDEAEVASADEKVPVVTAQAKDVEEQFWGKRHCFERLIATESNRLPFLAAQEISCKQNPRFNFLVILGEPGFGKTALLEAIAEGAKSSGTGKKCVYEMAETWCNDYYHAIQKRSTRKFRNYYRTADLLLLDGIQFLQGKAAAQDELLFTTKTLNTNGARVVLSCSCNPNELNEIKPEIRSLLKGAFWAELIMPPAHERVQMVQQLANLHRIRMEPAVCSYLAQSFTLSIQDLNSAVATIATYASLERRYKIDMETANSALTASGRNVPKSISAEDICKAAASANGITVDSLKGGSRARNICRARQMAILLTRELTDLSLSDIGRVFGRSHSTIKHSVVKASKLEKENSSFTNMLAKIRKEFGR